MAGGWAFVGTGSSGGTTTPGGSDTNIQFNNNGSFSGSALLTTDGSGSLSASVNISASAFYGDGSNLTGVTASAVQVADGPEYSLQFRFDTPVSGDLSGSSDLTWDTGTKNLLVTGNVSASINISGSGLYAIDAYVSSVPADRVLVSTTGGKVTSHSPFTFSSDVLRAPDISASANISGSEVYITDAYVSSVPVNRVLVSTTGGKLTSHSPFTFISDVLAVPDISASANISGSEVYVTNAYVSSVPANRVLVSTTDGKVTSHSPFTFTSDVLAAPTITASVGIQTEGFEVTSSTNGSINIGEGVNYNYDGIRRLDIFENEFKLNTTQFYQAMSPVKTTNFDVRNFQVFPVDTTGSVITGTLPGIVSDDDIGITFTVKDSEGSGSTNNVVIAASGSQKIDSASQLKIEVNYGSATVSAISGASGYFWSIISTSP